MGSDYSGIALQLAQGPNKRRFPGEPMPGPSN